MRPPRGPARRLSPIQILILCNLTVAAFIYGVVQWQFSAKDSRAVRLGGGGQVSTEQELQSSARELELMATRNMAHDKQMRAASPPIDWDTLSNERADVMAAEWEAVSEKVWFKQPGYHLSYPEEDPPYPFQRIKYIDGKDTGIVAIIAPFYDTNYYRAEAARALFWRLKAKGHIMIGITSYQEFPGTIVNPYDDRHTTPQDEIIFNSVEAWLHCFREPDKVLPRGIPRIYLSESDFHDPDRNDGGGSLVPTGAPKQFDLVYSNQGGDWNDFARNWTLAKASIKLLIEELDLKVLILGRDLGKPGDGDLQEYIRKGQIETRPPNTPWRDFLKMIEGGRALFAPNVHDASPRVLAEALCLDVPIVVNNRIVGGWKYVNQYTGEFFEDTTNVVAAFKRLFSPERQTELFPREWFKSTWGKTRASYKLQAFMEGVVGQDRLKTIQRDLAAAHQG